MASTLQVFSTPELLEHFLLYIPERDLLLSQRVNHTFRNLIKNSPRLQSRLFYTADIYHEGDMLKTLEFNPLLKFFYARSLRKFPLHIVFVRWQRWRDANQNNLLSFEDFVCIHSLV